MSVADSEEEYSQELFYSNLTQDSDPVTRPLIKPKNLERAVINMSSSTNVAQQLSVLARFSGVDVEPSADVSEEFDFEPNSCLVMSERTILPDERKKVWATLFALYPSFSDDKARATLRTAILKDAALNSTSSARKFVGQIGVALGDGMKLIDRASIKKALAPHGVTYRVFIQQYANEIHEMLKRDPGFATKCAQNVTRTTSIYVDPNFKSLCFDVAEYIDGLSHADAVFINRMKTGRLEGVDNPLNRDGAAINAKVSGAGDAGATTDNSRLLNY